MKKLSLFLMLIYGLLLNSVTAESLTPENYIQADLKARQVTIDGMEKRLILLQQNASDDEQIVSADQTSLDVEQIFSSYGTTGGAHLVYGTLHGESIVRTIAAHPEWQEESVELERRFEVLLEQMDTILGDNQ